MASTNMQYGDPQAMVEQAAGVFAAHNRRNGIWASLEGKMPKGSESAVATIRKQTTEHMPIVKAQDLTKGRGDRIKFNLIQPFKPVIVMGSEYAEGKGAQMDIVEDGLKVDQVRMPVNLGNAMTNLRSPVEFRAFGRPLAQASMDKYMDQSTLVHVAGARGFQNNIEWVLPLAADAKFNATLINKVKAPTKNRHYIASASAGITPFAQTAGEVNLANTNLMTMSTIDAIRAEMENIPLPPPMVQFPGDVAAMDSPLRVLMVSAAQYSSFVTDPTFRQLTANAMARSTQAGGHNIFKGEAGLWNGILIVKMPKPIRFYSGDEIKYCADTANEVESSCIVPVGFGANFAIDRAILLGGQALAKAMGVSDHSSLPMFWSEEPGDHNDKMELLIGAIVGFSKVRFEINYGDSKQFTDYGATVIDTAVKIGQPRS